MIFLQINKKLRKLKLNSKSNFIKTTITNLNQ